MEERLKNYRKYKARLDYLYSLKKINHDKFYGPSGGGIEATGVRAKGKRDNPSEVKIIKKIESEKDIDEEIRWLEHEIYTVDIVFRNEVLSSEEEQIIRLFYFKELSLDAIAQTINVADKGTVSDRKKKALEKMQTIEKPMNCQQKANE